MKPFEHSGASGVDEKVGLTRDPEKVRWSHILAVEPAAQSFRCFSFFTPGGETGCRECDRCGRDLKPHALEGPRHALYEVAMQRPSAVRPADFTYCVSLAETLLSTAVEQEDGKACDPG